MEDALKRGMFWAGDLEARRGRGESGRTKQQNNHDEEEEEEEEFVPRGLVQ